MRRLTYWLLTTEYPPLHGGGISTYCHYTAKMLAAGGVNVSVLVPDDGIRDHEIRQEETGVRVIRFNSDRSGLSNDIGYAARLSYEFAVLVRTLIGQGETPDIIEAQDYLGIACYLLQFKHLLYPDVKDIPIVLTLHSPAFLYLEYNRVPTYRFPDFWTGEMEIQAIRMADHLISPTAYLADVVRRYVPFPDDRLTVLRNPFYGVRDTTFPAERNKILYYGKLSPQKGSFELLAYFRDLWKEGFTHPLHIVGGTDIVYHPERMTMGQLVERDYGEYIRNGLLLFRGKIAPSALADELRSAHVVIVPSIVDNLPYVVLEAMSLGKVVLVSVQGGQREIIEEGIDGFLFDHTLEGDFSRQLKKVLSLSTDELLGIGDNARAKLNSVYHGDVIGPKKLQELHSILQNKAAERSLAKRSFPLAEHSFPFLYQEPFTELKEETDNNTLSIVIPFYNMGAYIRECIRSVQASTYPDREIVIVDDGSTEQKSLAVLEELEQEKNIKVYRKKNEGLAKTRNYGADCATGRFLAFLDADDCVDPTYYEKAIRVLRQQKNVFFVGSWVRYFGDSQKKWVTFLPQPPYLLIHNTLNSSGLVYKKAAFCKGGLNDHRVDYGLEDYESVIHLTALGYNGVVLPEFLFRYRVRENSMFRKITREKLLYSYKYITEKHASYYVKFAPSTIHLLNANGPGFLFDNPTFEVFIHTRSEITSPLLRKIKQIIKRNKFLKKIALKLIK